MASILDQYRYPFDPQGTSPANKVTNEQHPLQQVNWRDYHFIVPKQAPFFKDSIVIELRNSTNQIVPLTEGVDYYFSHQFHDASLACAKPIYGSISFLNTSLQGNVIIRSYQTVGGEWNIDEAQIQEILADRLHNPRTTTWEQVVELPWKFPVVDHEWDLVDMVGASELQVALLAIRDAILTAGGGGGGGGPELQAHIANKFNPHEVTKAQVGLGSVQNYGMANDAQGVGNAANLYASPRNIDMSITQKALVPLNNFIARRDNPNQVTAAQTGAYTQTEVNNLLAGKLDIAATAQDSTRFAGRTYADVRADILTGTAANSVLFNGMAYTAVKADVLTGTSANSSKVYGMDMNAMTAFIDSRVVGGGNGFAHQAQLPGLGLTGDAWTQLTDFRMDADTNDLQVIVAGGLNATSDQSGLYLVRVCGNVTTGPKIFSNSLNGVDADITFGYSPTATGYRLWAKTPGNRKELTVTEMDDADGELATDAGVEVVQTEPTGILYAVNGSGGGNYVTVSEFQAFSDALALTFNTLAGNL